LFDGSGYEYNYQFSVLNFQSKLKDQQSSIQLKLIDKKYIDDEKQKIFLGFGILHDRARLEWMMEKCTELGVDGFVPLITDNCQVAINNAKIKNQKACSGLDPGSKPQLKILKLGKIERLEKKIIEACEQSGRVRVPIIEDVQNVEDVLNDSGWKVIVMEKSDKFSIINLQFSFDESLRDNHKKYFDRLENKQITNIILLVGPEGGWSEREIQMFKDKKLEFMTVSDNVLRAETAALIGIQSIKLRIKK
jgi:16S rRNA (uracil1498-N3)-methyltransferase